MNDRLITQVIDGNQEQRMNGDRREWQEAQVKLLQTSPSSYSCPILGYHVRKSMASINTKIGRGA